MAQLTDTQMKLLFEDQMIGNFMKEIGIRSIPQSYNRYKGNWGQLISIVEKIEDIEITEGSYADIQIGPHNYIAITLTESNKEFIGDGLSKVDSLYDCIIKFLTWYNAGKISNNILLAEFLNFPKEYFKPSNYLNYGFNNSWYEAEELSFHSSWNWLLPVITKILNNRMPKIVDHLYTDIEKNLKLGNLKECYDLSVQYIKNYY